MMNSFSLKNFIGNLYYLFCRNLTSDMCQFGIRQEVLRLQVLSLPEVLQSRFVEEIAYLKSNGYSDFPYSQVKHLNNVESGLCPSAGLPFVLHEGKKLFFPACYSVSKAESMYRRYIERECLLGGGYMSKAPHQYQSAACQVCPGDVVVDAGAAEGLLGLHVLDMAKRVYIVESDPLWQRALKATFSPYADKVEIVRKRLGNRDSRNSIRLESLLGKHVNSEIFLKMDIEGAEMPVLESSMSLLERTTEMRICCCSYHRQNDDVNIEKLLGGIGYSTERSDGYILYSMDSSQRIPYFRTGVVRAWKK